MSITALDQFFAGLGDLFEGDGLAVIVAEDFIDDLVGKCIS